MPLGVLPLKETLVGRRSSQKQRLYIATSAEPLGYKDDNMSGQRQSRALENRSYNAKADRRRDRCPQSSRSRALYTDAECLPDAYAWARSAVFSV